VKELEASTEEPELRALRLRDAEGATAMPEYGCLRISGSGAYRCCYYAKPVKKVVIMLFCEAIEMCLT
jgi:hypothetical protein